MTPNPKLTGIIILRKMIETLNQTLKACENGMGAV